MEKTKIKKQEQAIEASEPKVSARKSFSVVLSDILQINNLGMDAYPTCLKIKEYIDSVDFLNTPIDGVHPPFKKAMTKEEILQKIIEKASAESLLWDIVLNTFNFNFNKFVENGHYYRLIFSHSFAKAFWGEEKHTAVHAEYSCDYCDGDYSDIEYCWQYHLQQMALEPEPLDYLKKFL